jgi:hypothetical protein
LTPAFFRLSTINSAIVFDMCSSVRSGTTMGQLG